MRLNSGHLTKPNLTLRTYFKNIQEIAIEIIEHRKRIGEFRSVNDLVVVNSFGGTKSLNLLRPEIKVIETPKRPIKPIPRKPECV